MSKEFLAKVFEPELESNQTYDIYQYGYMFEFIDKIYYSKFNESLIKATVKFQELQGNIEYNQHLAGDIKYESLIKLENDSHLEQQFTNEFKTHIERIYQKPVEDLKFQGVWINRMKANEHNPLHTHNGILSFVLYVDIPEEIRQESHQQKTLGNSRGLITFFAARSNETMTFNPRNNDIFIFDANHHHCVYPFYSDNVRVSIAGNIEYIKFRDGTTL